MPEIRARQVNDFTGGLNYRADQFQLADNESPDMLNMEIDPRGGVFNRGGMRRINAVDVAGTWHPHALFPFRGASRQIMLANDTQVLRSTGGNFSTLQFTGSVDIVTSNYGGASFAEWGKTLYIGTGVATPTLGGHKWVTTDALATSLTPSGTAPNAWQTLGDTGGKMPSAELLVVHANKMFAANTHEAGVALPNRLRWSIENSPEDWKESDYIDINGGGDGITAVVVVAGQLVIFKPTAIYVLLGYYSANFQVVELSASMGVLDSTSVAQSEQGVYWYVVNAGLFYYDGSSITDMFQNIRPIIDLDYITPNIHHGTSVSWIGRRVWLSIPYSKTGAVTTPTVNFVLDPTMNDGSWTMFRTADNYGLTSGCNWTDTDNNDYRLMIHPVTACVMRVDMYEQIQDDISGANASFASMFRTRWFDGGTYLQKKMFRRPDIVVKESATTQVIDVAVFHNFKEATGQERRTFTLNQTTPAGVMIWGSGLWGEPWGGAAESSIILKGANLGLASSVQLKFDGPLNQTWGINSIGYKFQLRKVKG